MLAVAVQASLPCGGVYRRTGKDGPLEMASIASEKAIIVWEPSSQTETFIRTANFQGKGADFGFIVPSPTEPELSEVTPGVYSVLDVILNKRYPHPVAPGGLRAGSGGFGGGSGGGHVEIVKEQVVSGMKATVLKATDTEALELWLANNEYVATPEVMRWTEFYVANNYYLTAFKIDRKPGSDQIKTATVKMVFRTKIPFYPYREPQGQSQKNGARSLAVYFIAPWLAKARYMNSNQTWEASRKDVDDMDQDEGKRFTDTAKMDLSQTPAEPKFTYFLDSNRIRPDRDVIFERR